MDRHGRIARNLLAIVVAIVASIGQVQFAREKRFTHLIEIPRTWTPAGDFLGFDLTPWLAVAVFDLAIAALLYAGRGAFRRDLSPWPFWIAAAAVAALSTYTNAQHRGAWITAPASGVLFFLLFLGLYYEYMEWRRAAGHLADTAPKLLLSRLAIIDPRLAYRAWVIASTRPVATRGVAHRRARGEKVTVRDLAVLAARLYRDIYTDQYAGLLREAHAQAAAANAGRSRVRRLLRRDISRAEMAQIRGRAEMTSADAVDHYLGLPVIERTGVQIARVSYAPAIQEPAPTPPRHLPARVSPPPAPKPPTPRQMNGSQTTMVPISAPPAQTLGVPDFLDVPDVPEELFEVHARRIQEVQAAAGDSWWLGETALTVNQVQALGVGNRQQAATIARCLKVLRQRRRQGGGDA